MSISLPAPDDQKSFRPTPEQLVMPHQYGQFASQKEEADDEIDLRELFGVVMRRKGTIALIALLTFIAALVATLMMKPIYRASTTLQIAPETAKVLDFDVEAESGRQAVNTKDFYQTQYEILKSRALAKDVIEKEGLERYFQGDQLAKPFFTETLDGLKSVFFGSNDTEEYEDFTLEEEVTATTSSLGKRPLEDRLIANLTISPVKNSQIVKLSYDSTDPQLAQKIVNTIAVRYKEMNLQRRIDASRSAKEFLSREVDNAESRMALAEAEKNNYATAQGFFRVEDTEGTVDLVVKSMLSIGKELEVAKALRIKRQAEYEKAVQTTGELDILDNPVVQSLKKRLIDLQAKQQESALIYKPSYPLMRQLRQQIAEVKTQVQLEERRITRAAQNELKVAYSSAKKHEEDLAAELQELRSSYESKLINNSEYSKLAQNAKRATLTYQGLSKRLDEVTVAGSTQSDNISILDRAIVPFAKHKPNTKLNLALGLVLGVFLGTVVAFLLEFLDDRVKTTDALERLLQMPLLGMTPSVKGDDPAVHALMTKEDPASAVAESFRSLRTNLLFASKEGTPKVLVLTSAMPSEGKSSSCINLATAFAQANSKVLVIDADLRKPTAHKRLKLDNSVGLSSFLTSQAETADVIQETSIQGVSMITAGPLAPNPSELLTSERLGELFALAPDTFDLIIVDAPPVMGLADALVLSNRASATIMVTAFAQSKKRQIQDAHRRLKQANANLIGVLFTKVKTGGSYGGYYDNYDTYYTYGTGRVDNKTES